MSYKDYYESIELGNLEEDAADSSDPTVQIAWKIRTQRTIKLMHIIIQAFTRVPIVVDIGCAGGWLHTGLKNSTHRYVGCDISHQYLTYWKDSLNSSRVVCDAGNLPFQNAKSDIVVSLEIIEHLPNPDCAAKEIRRVSNHFAVISVPLEGVSLFSLDVKRYNHSAQMKEKAVRDFIAQVGWAKGLRLIAKKTGAAHINFFTRNKLINLFNDTEFETHYTIGAFFLLPKLKTILEKRPTRIIYEFLERVLFCRIPIFASYIRFLPFGGIGNLYGILILRRIKKDTKLT
jgi:SAM-dependent methyltransferase